MTVEGTLSLEPTGLNGMLQASKFDSMQIRTMGASAAVYISHSKQQLQIPLFDKGSLTVSSGSSTGEITVAGRNGEQEFFTTQGAVLAMLATLGLLMATGCWSN